jgi:hypothetical protein
VFVSTRFAQRACRRCAAQRFAPVSAAASGVHFTL